MDLSDFAKVGIGCVLLSGSIKNINYFSTNRYLLDAVSAKQIPDYDVLNSDYFVNEIITYFKLPKITGSRSVDSKWSETVKNLIKKINKNEPFKTKKFWNKKRKDFFNKNGFIIIPNFIKKNKIELYRKKPMNYLKLRKKVIMLICTVMGIKPRGSIISLTKLMFLISF